MLKLTRVVLSISMLTAPFCLAQSTHSRMPLDGTLDGHKGFSSYTSFEQTHDSSSNWSSVVDSSVSYDFNRVFGMAVGVPFYLTYQQINASSPVPPTGSQPVLSPTYNALGDARFALRFATPTPVLRYVVTVTGTAPTGDRASGISTGRATADFNNHLEFDLGRITPLMDLGIANTNTLIALVRRPYTTLGTLSHFKGGLSVPLFKGLSAEFIGYENLPLGLQKLYSHEFGKGSGSSGSSGPGKSSPIYQQASTVVGNGISEDNGFSTGLNTNLGKRLDMNFTYDHSVRQKLDTYAFSVGVRLGKTRSK